MFIHGFPYTDLSEINLDFILKKIDEIRTAAGIKFDDETAQIDADNVQTAIEKLKDLIDHVSTMSQKVVVIENQIPETYWENGHSFTHLQTVNDPTCSAIVDALRNDKIIILKRSKTSGTDDFYDFYIQNEVVDKTADYQHILTMTNFLTDKLCSCEINGLNDDLNVNVVLNADVQRSTVNTFNGRSGDVTPTSGDYEAGQISYDDDNTQLGATDVQTAIETLKLLIPLLYVESFNGRNGTVTPTSGDYEADQITYDNQVSGLTATDVQAAIDELVNSIFSSGVASFNGRVGVVLPVAGDYGADDITLDTSNTDLPNTITNLQEYVEYMHPAQVTVVLTLNGAKEDTITVKDSNNNTLGTCIFGSGQTSGTLTINVPAGFNESCTFTSSVAKDTTTGTSDYVKTATVTDASTQTIDVMPDKIGYWFGRGTLTGYPIPRTSGAPSVTPTVTDATNSVSYTAIDTGSFAVLCIGDFDDVTNIKCLCTITATCDDTELVVKSDNTTNITDDHIAETIITGAVPLPEGIRSLAVSTSGTKYVGIFQRTGLTSQTNSGTIKAIWFE